MAQIRWMLPILFLVVVLTVPQLNMDAYSYDEMRSLVVVGAAQYGPLAYPGEVLARLTDQSPDQAPGFALLLAPWGALVGWSEFATRVLPLLAALLAVSVTYRAGADFFHPVAGRAAALVLATSIFYLTYAHKLRVFSLASLAVMAALWCYWRIMVAQRPPPVWAYVGLGISGIGLFYTHYFTTPFFGVLALYHLLFAPKNRAWWRVCAVAGGVVLAYAPFVPVLLEGFAHNQAKATVQAAALRPGGVMVLLARFFGNGASLATVAVMLLGLWAARSTDRTRPVMFLLWCIGGLLLSILAMNALAGVLAPHRARYLMPLWGPLALLAGLGVWGAYTHARYTAVILLVAWGLSGVTVTLQNDLMYFDQGDQSRVPPWRELTAPLHEQAAPGDAFVYLGERFGYHHGHYTHGLNTRPVVPPYEGQAEMQTAINGATRVWWTGHAAETPPTHQATFEDVLADAGFAHCADVFADGPFMLRLAVASPAFCPANNGIRVPFGDSITLRAVEVTQQDNQTIINLGWAIAPGFHPAQVSASIRATAPDDTLLAQADVGFGAAQVPFIPMRITLPVDNPHTLNLIVYNWQSGRRFASPQGDDMWHIPVGAGLGSSQ